MINRYSRWDGSQEPPALDADELMEAMADDLLDHGDPWRALQRLLRRGAENQNGDRQRGLQDLLDQVRRQRQQRLEQNNLSGVMDDIKRQLDEIVQTERQGIDKRVQEARQQSQQSGDAQEASLQKMLERMADQRRQQLDQLPGDPAGQIQQLSDYEFMDADARQKFQDLLDMLKQQMMQQQFQGMQQAIQGMSPEAMGAMREMLRDLNQMLREHAEGGQPDFDGFMDKWGQMFPGVNNLDELIEQLRESAAQMQSMMDSMSPNQRRELRELMEAAMQEAGLEEEMAELAMNLSQIAPMGDLRKRYSFRGDDPVSLQEAMKMFEELQQLDKLERQIRRAEDDADLDAIDAEKLRQLLGDDAANTLEQLRQLRKMLEEAGFLEKKGDRYELTARALRRIGQRALRDIFAQLRKDRFGNHTIEQRGPGGDRTDETKRYEFGDPFMLDLRTTVMNAVERTGAGTPVKLDPADFEVFRTEHTTQSSTVIMLDMSRSMILRGCFRAAKKVTMALNSLIKGQFPRDALYVVGFSYYAQEIRPDDLPKVSWSEWVYGTNMQHGFMLSRQLLARHRGGNRQIIMITDGEPTAHFENGRVEFAYPPTLRTFQETFREVNRCTREGITINTFMLEQSSALQSFVEQLTKINHGRAFYSGPEQLGKYILVDYVNRKRQVSRRVS
jgi:uncharacterized protein with von Willebrand factor type A (vWA) domain